MDRWPHPPLSLVLRAARRTDKFTAPPGWKSASAMEQYLTAVGCQMNRTSSLPWSTASTCRRTRVSFSPRMIQPEHCPSTPPCGQLSGPGCARGRTAPAARTCAGSRTGDGARVRRCLPASIDGCHRDLLEQQRRRIAVVDVQTRVLLPSRLRD